MKTPSKKSQILYLREHNIHAVMNFIGDASEALKYNEADNEYYLNGFKLGIGDIIEKAANNVFKIHPYKSQSIQP